MLHTPDVRNAGVTRSRWLHSACMQHDQEQKLRQALAEWVLSRPEVQDMLRQLAESIPEDATIGELRNMTIGDLLSGPIRE